VTGEEIYSEIVNGIITVLRDNVEDPDTDRSGAGRNFIYDRWPNETATMPRISLTALPHGDTECMDISTLDELVNTQVQIDIWVNDKSTFTISGETYNKSKLLDYLAGKVTHALRSHAADLAGFNIHGMKRTRPFGDMASGIDNVIRSIGEYEVIYYQSYD